HDGSVDRRYHVNAGIAALDFQNYALSYLLGCQELHLIDRTHRLEFTPGKESVLARVYTNHLQLSQPFERLFGEVELQLAFQRLVLGSINSDRRAVPSVLERLKRHLLVTYHRAGLDLLNYGTARRPGHKEHQPRVRKGDRGL